MKLFVEIEGIGKVQNVYLSSAEIQKIDTIKSCLTCGSEFIIGQYEVDKAMSTDKGRAKTSFEIFINEEIKDIRVNKEGFLTHFGDSTRKGKNGLNKLKEPIDLSSFLLVEKAVIFGVHCVNRHVCHTCRSNNSMKDNPGDLMYNTAIKPQ